MKVLNRTGFDREVLQPAMTEDTFLISGVMLHRPEYLRCPNAGARSYTHGPSGPFRSGPAAPERGGDPAAQSAPAVEIVGLVGSAFTKQRHRGTSLRSLGRDADSSSPLRVLRLIFQVLAWPFST